MNLEKKLVSALNSKDKAKIESVFRQIYDSYFKLVYFCISNYVSVKEDIDGKFYGVMYNPDEKVELSSSDVALLQRVILISMN